jgi:hypothetical protein
MDQEQPKQEPANAAKPVAPAGWRVSDWQSPFCILHSAFARDGRRFSDKIH